MMRKTILVSVALTAFTLALVLAALHLRNGNCSKEEDEMMLDLTRWKEGNIKELLHLAHSVRLTDNVWPNVLPQDTDMQDDQARRRLEQTDKWSMEEIKMRDEVTKYFSDMKSTKPLSHPALRPLKDTRASPERKQKARGLQDLPPISTNCTDPTSVNLPCPPEELPKLCDKYSSGGNFELCFQTCKRSFCCSHDSKSRLLAPSCANEPNCRNYIPCYIVWWKLSDTVGPATFLRLPPVEGFFKDVDVDYIKLEINDQAKAAFYEQLFQHHKDDDTEWDDALFLESGNWDKTNLYYNSQ